MEIKIYENKDMKVEISGNKGVITLKRFGDTYGFRIDENNVTVAYSALGLKRAKAARDVFGF